MLRYYPHTLRPMLTDQTILGHHLTSLMEKSSMKWSKYETTNVMDALEHYNTSSNGKEVPKVTIHGSQLT